MTVKNIELEFDAATNDVALVDRSRLGRIEVTGADRLDLLHRLSTNNLISLKPMQSVGTVFVTDKGRIVDFVRVLVKEDSLLLVTSAGTEENFMRWIERYTIMEDIKLRVTTEPTAMVSLLGPRAVQVAEKKFEIELRRDSLVEKDGMMILHRHEFETAIVDVIIEGGCAAQLTELLNAAGSTTIGEEAYQTFRISRGMPEHGSELSEAFNPYEVGLRDAMSFTKGCYLGQEIIARLDTYGKVQKTMRGVVLREEDAAPRAGSKMTFSGEDIGTLTSISPMAVHGKRVGLCVVRKDAVSTDNTVGILSDGNVIPGIIASIPVPLK